MSIDAVRRYYRHYDELSRLDTPAGQLELARCLEALDARLSTDSRVLDLGGGPGRYTLDLARRGHRVTLVDLLDEHIALAEDLLRHQGLLDQVEALQQGDARHLGAFDDASFDGVIAFGPFYHLTDAEDRHRAAGEVARVLRPGGAAFVQFLPPLIGYVRLLDRAAETPEQIDTPTLERARDEQIYRNPTTSGFQEGYYATPDDITTLFEEAGLRTTDILSVRGLAAGREDRLERLRHTAPEVYAAFTTLLDETSRDPAIIALGQIALWIGDKPPS